MTKEEARKEARAQRAALSADERTALSDGLAQVFLEAVPLEGVGWLNAFLPLERHREPDLRPLLHQLHAGYPQIRLTIPQLPAGAVDFNAVVYEPGIALEPGHYGTELPANPVLVEASEIDLVLVPLLAYDRRGYRAGYGGGYYDRFLTRCRADVQKIGVSFFGPVDCLDDVWNGDVRLDACLTPAGLVSF